ncbi:MAG: leucine-rich repeat domain-containing protein [Bacteroidaceae bacterium]|nr:leucine-rich repeat domain-containing protein [Bacteroidaceae bacterium]
MKKIVYLACVIASAALGACSEEAAETPNVLIGQEVEHITVKLPDMVYDDDNDASTRAAFTYKPETDAFGFTWTSGDVLGVFPNKGAQVDFPIDEAFVGTNSADFDGGGWALKTGYTYAVYYPYDYYNRDKTAIPMNYVGQTQKNANDYSHLNAFNYFASKEAITATGPSLSFNVGYMGTIIWMPFTMPVSTTLKEIRLVSDNLPFITQANLDISGPTPTFTPTMESQTISLKLNNIAVTAGVESNFYMWILPRDYRESKLTAEIVTTTDDVYVVTLYDVGGNSNLRSGSFKNLTRSSTTSKPITLKGSESSKVVDAMKSLKTAWGSPAALNWPANPSSASDYSGATGVTVEGGKITKIELSGKGLSGTLPECIGDLKDLTVLDLSNNSLSGTIPESIGNLTNLTTLDLSSNNFSSYKPSAAPQLASTESTSSLAPTLATAFPTTIGNLTKLMTLDLSGNKLSGEIPSSVGNLKQLQVLVLSDNDITGGLPTFIAVLPLVVLDLSNNEFTGDFVKWFFEELPVIPTLKELKLEGNNLTGEVTEEMQESERWQNLGDNVAVSEQQGGSIEVEGQVTDLNNPSATIESFSETEYDW